MTMRTVATILSLMLGGFLTCHSVGIGEVDTCSESNADQNDNHHENPKIREAQKEVCTS